MADTGGDVLIETILDWGVDVIFGLPGDGINGIMEALRKRQEKIRFIQVRHEESAAFMACAYAKYTGKLGVCLATSGPGASDPKLRDFKNKLNDVLLDLALQVVRDGEGAGKLIKVSVSGAENDEAAKRVALSIANSPLVKTAIAGNDANWGRVVMAVGKSGEKADRDKLRIWFGKQMVAEKGERALKYNEEKATKAVSKLEVEIGVDLRLGRGKARVWTCDLTHGYIDINGSYRS